MNGCSFILCSVCCVAYRNCVYALLWICSEHKFLISWSTSRKRSIISFSSGSKKCDDVSELKKTRFTYNTFALLPVVVVIVSFPKNYIIANHSFVTDDRMWASELGTPSNWTLSLDWQWNKSILVQPCSELNNNESASIIIRIYPIDQVIIKHLS